MKLPAYLRGGVPLDWIVNIQQSHLETYERVPAQTSRAAQHYYPGGERPSVAAISVDPAGHNVCFNGQADRGGLHRCIQATLANGGTKFVGGRSSIRDTRPASIQLPGRALARVTCCGEAKRRTTVISHAEGMFELLWLLLTTVLAWV